MTIKGFILVNEDKVYRAINGTALGNGGTVGGVAVGAYFEEGVWKRNGEELGAEEVETLETALLAEYDKLGGLILKGEDKVKTGSFYDFKGKKPMEKPKVVFTYRVNGENVEVPDGVELPGQVKAVKALGEKKARKSKKKVEDEE